MNKLKEILYLATLLFSIPCVAQSNVIYSCDVNRDNCVDVVDINTVVNTILNHDNPYSNNCDLNGDGVVDVIDINQVISHIFNANPPAAISWIDDDMNAFDWSQGGTLRPVYQHLHDFCLEHQIFPDIARGTFSTPYNKTVPKALVDLCLEWQSEGFNYIYHPNHSYGWYNYDAKNPHDTTRIEYSILDCYKGFDFYGFKAANILVWPGNSAEFKDNYPIVERHYDCAIAATYKETNHRAENDRFCLKRLSFESLRVGFLTKTQFKELLKNAIDNGDWVILASHFYSIIESDVPDETSYNTANVYELVQYADSLCRIRPTGEVWRERRHLWE